MFTFIRTKEGLSIMPICLFICLKRPLWLSIIFFVIITHFYVEQIFIVYFLKVDSCF